MLVLFVMALLSVLVFCVVVLSPVVLALLAATHVKEEDMSADKGIETVAPLQMVAVFALVMDGKGFTVTVITSGKPEQPAAIDCTVYTAVPAPAPVKVRFCAIVFPDPLEAPVTPDCVTVQV